MAINRQESDQEAIWDDSALIDSWNMALAEYKVRGGKGSPAIEEID